MGDTAIAKKYFPERWESARRNINNLRRGREDLHARYAAEKAMAKEIFAEEEKIAVGKEVEAIRKYKDFRERNEEERDLIIQAAKACMFDSETKELLPSDQQDRANFARCMTVAAQLTAQIKPIGGDDKPTQSQTVNFNLSNLSDEELKTLAPIVAKLEGTAKGAGEKASP